MIFHGVIMKILALDKKEWGFQLSSEGFGLGRPGKGWVEDGGMQYPFSNPYSETLAKQEYKIPVSSSW